MGNEVNLRNVASVDAVQQYLGLRTENSDRHKANVLVHAHGKDLTPGVRFISVKVCENVLEIIIEDFHTIYGDRSNRFTLEDSNFSFIGKTMEIKAKDTFGFPITVAITTV